VPPGTEHHGPEAELAHPDACPAERAQLHGPEHRRSRVRPACQPSRNITDKRATRANDGCRPGQPVPRDGGMVEAPPALPSAAAACPAASLRAELRWPASARLSRAECLARRKPPRLGSRLAEIRPCCIAALRPSTR